MPSNMYCQKCRQPLNLDSSLQDLNPAAYDLLVASSSQPPKSSHSSSSPIPKSQEQARKSRYDQVSQNAGPPTFKRNHAGAGHARDSAMSFIYLTESQIGHPHPSQPNSSSSPPATPTPKLRRSSTSGSGNGAANGPQTETPRGDEMHRLNRLFEILSARSDVDHPICVDCTEMLVEGFQKKLDGATKERDAYVKHLKSVRAHQPSDEDIKVQQEALKKADKEKRAAMEELRRLEKEKDSLDEEILALEEESRNLDKDEEEFWRDRNAFATKMADFQFERDSVNTRYNNDSQLLEKLQRSNIYNDTFCISHDGSFATINGLRLGRLSSKPVDWPEINAAWGHALLLLVTVADKLNFSFQGYDAQPMGSTSRIIRYDAPSPTSSRATGPLRSSQQQQQQQPQGKKHVLELHSSGDMPLGLTFMHRKFDNAMVAFLELVRQLGAFVQHETTQRRQQQQQQQQQQPPQSDGGSGSSGNNAAPLKLPYLIEGDKIGDVSIRLGMAQDDGWTKACKLTLTCCKFLLAHASNVSYSSARNNNGGS